MNSNIGYIYLRNHLSYHYYNAYKLGKTYNIPSRDMQYATNEIDRGYFESVYELPINKMDLIERLLQYHFQHLNVKHNGGVEFYHKSIIEMIEPYLITLKINYRKLSKDDISNLLRPIRVKQTLQKINIRLLIQYLKQNITIKYKPREYQTEIINKVIIYFESKNKGLLVVPCGVGKTLISLWIIEKLNYKKILIGVPNKLLLKQWKQTIDQQFINTKCLIVSSGINTDDIIKFITLNSNVQIYFIITTYSSAYKVYGATKSVSNFSFDIKINDEVHHLTTIELDTSQTTKKYIEMLNIQSSKQLSLTATMKQLDDMNSNIISNDNIDYFGEIIDRRCLLWAIKKNIICDYLIQIIIGNGNDTNNHHIIFSDKDDIDKRLLLSAYTSLKTLNDRHSKHLLIYSNSRENSLKIFEYIKMFIDDNYFEISELYYDYYNGNMSSKRQKEIIDKFVKARFGIIICVYCLGEGWDCPLLDAVVFADNMNSNIRIVQSALRASRKNSLEPDKVTKIILPIFSLSNENQDLKKVKEVIYQIGLEDEIIIEKIRISKTDIKKSEITDKSEKEDLKSEFDFDTKKELMDKLRLLTVKRSSLGITYEKAKQIIISNKITSKNDYYELCNRDNRLSKEPEMLFKGRFTNWIDYLSIERNYYDLLTCIKKVDQYLILYPEMRKHNMELSVIVEEICKNDKKFPPSDLWIDYYDVRELDDIINIKNKKKKKVSNII